MKIFCVGTPIAYLEKKLLQAPSYKQFTDKTLLSSLRIKEVRVFINENEAIAYAESMRTAAKPPVTPISDAKIAPVFEAILPDDYQLPAQQNETVQYEIKENSRTRYNSEIINYYLVPREAVEQLISAQFANSNIPTYQFSEADDLSQKRCCIIS
ncbi:MAG: hypothetical protein HKM04_03030 [Legionellales bacterium]|nr:hypothetical protein [Legionellales bacterium]